MAACPSSESNHTPNGLRPSSSTYSRTTIIFSYNNIYVSNVPAREHQPPGSGVSLRKSRSCAAPQKSTPGGWPQAPTARSYTSPGQSPGCRLNHSPRAESPAYSHPRVHLRTVSCQIDPLPDRHGLWPRPHGATDGASAPEICLLLPIHSGPRTVQRLLSHFLVANDAQLRSCRCLKTPGHTR